MTESDGREDWEVAKDNLDEAIREYARINLGMDGVTTGWVLLVEAMRADDDGETYHSFRYSCGPTMSVSSARGLVENCRDELADQILRGQVGRQSDDD